MGTETKKVDGFRFLPPKLSAWIQTFFPDEDFSGTIPFRPLSKPLSAARPTLVTSAGISEKADPHSDMQRGKKNQLMVIPRILPTPKAQRKRISMSPTGNQSNCSSEFRSDKKNGN